MSRTTPEPTYFRSAAELRRWLRKHHGDTAELWVGFFKVGTGHEGITYREALDEALCHGWIDGVRKPAGADRYTIRFSPRKADSFWSPVNTKRARELVAEGRMAAAGLAAFERRDPNQTAKYSYERAAASFSPAEAKLFRANRKAWDFFQAQAPYYRRTCTWFVASAKRDETRLKRLERLIAVCAAGRRLI